MYNQIDKIFSSSKEKRSSSAIVEDPLLIKPSLDSSDDTRKSKNDMKIVKFNIKDQSSNKDSIKVSDKLRKIKSEATLSKQC